MAKDKPYKVTMSKFLGSHKFSDDHESYTYEITFNQSIVHTGRWKGIEDGLNAYRKKERRTDIWESIKNTWYSIKNWAKG